MASIGRAEIDTALVSLLRRKWLALAVFGLVLAGTVSFAKALPNLYQSTATVLVEHPAPAAGTDDVETRLQSIRQQILSRTRLAETIGRFDLYPKLRRVASQEAAVERMRRDLRIEMSGSDLATGRGTIAFSLSYRGRDPHKVTQVANSLTASYIEEDKLSRERQTSGAADALQVQLEDVKQRLAQQEEKIAAFKKTHAGELPQQAEAGFLAIERLNAQIQKVNETRTAALERRATLMSEDGGAEAAPDPDRARLQKLTQELQELRTRFSDRYPDVVQKMAEVETLSAKVAAKPQVDRALPRLEQVNAEIRRLQAEEERLRGEIAGYRRRVEGAPWREQEYQALSRDYATTKDFYDSLLKRYEEAQLAEARDSRPRGQHLRLLDAAIIPTNALAPDRFRLAMFGLIASLGLAVVAVAAAERLDGTFHSPDQLRAHTRVPLLVRIPRIDSASAPERARGRWRAALLSLGLVLGIALSAGAFQILGRDNEAVVALLAPRGRS